MQRCGDRKALRYRHVRRPRHRKCFDARLELPKAIAKGDDVCALRYIKSSDGQGGEMRKVDNSLIVAFCFAFFPKMRREGEHFTF